MVRFNPLHFISSEKAPGTLWIGQCMDAIERSILILSRFEPQFPSWPAQNLVSVLSELNFHYIFTLINIPIAGFSDVTV
jgi:hypothetical protein